MPPQEERKRKVISDIFKSALGYLYDKTLHIIPNGEQVSPGLFQLVMIPLSPHEEVINSKLGPLVAVTWKC